MTDINKLAKVAIRTESVVPDLNGQVENLKAALELVAIAGGILDQVKRKIFYGAKGDYNHIKLNALVDRLVQIDTFAFTGDEMQHNNVEQRVDVNTRIVHGIVGSVTETAEMAEALVEYLNTGAIDAVNLVEEIFDSRWYALILQDELNVSDKDGFELLIAKLSARYGDRFSDVAAVIRDIGTEREVMERILRTQTEVQ